MMQLVNSMVSPVNAVALPREDACFRPATLAHSLSDEAADTGADTLFARVLPDFVLEAARTTLLYSTSSLTKVASRAHQFFSRVSSALAFGRLMRAFFPWAVPTAQDLLSGPYAFRSPSQWRQRPAVPSFDVIPGVWWERVSEAFAPKPDPVVAIWFGFWGLKPPRSRREDWLSVAMLVVTPLSVLGYQADPFAWAAFAWTV